MQITPTADEIYVAFVCTYFEVIAAAVWNRDRDNRKHVARIAIIKTVAFVAEQRVCEEEELGATE